MYDERYNTGRPMRGELTDRSRKDPEVPNKEVRDQFGKLPEPNTEPK